MLHILKRIEGGKGIEGWIQPECSCGWKGRKEYAHNDYQHSNVAEQEHNHESDSKGCIRKSDYRKKLYDIGERTSRMNREPEQAYVYQPYPPTKEGKFYGVSGPDSFGFEDGNLKGLSLKDASEIARFCNENPEFAASFVRGLKGKV